MADPKWTNGKWKPSVNTLADLPLQGNSDGDCREVLDPGGAGSMPVVYCWDEDLAGPNKWFPATLSGPPMAHGPSHLAGQADSVFPSGLLAGRPVLGAGDIGYLYFATDQGANGSPLWWNGAAWVDAASVIVP